MKEHEYRRELGSVAGSLAVSAALFLWNRVADVRQISLTFALSVFGLLVPACLWLGSRAFRRHLQLAKGRSRSYVSRHIGLAFALTAWTGTSYSAAMRELTPGMARTALLWEFAFHSAISLPIWLWAGLWWLSTVRRGLGIDHERAD